MSTDLELMKRMLLIRFFEERVDKLFGAGELKGTSHLALGEEAKPKLKPKKSSTTKSYPYKKATSSQKSST